jgi:hypothetical protein
MIEIKAAKLARVVGREQAGTKRRVWFPVRVSDEGEVFGSDTAELLGLESSTGEAQQWIQC